ncbi:SWIM zinc finger family protein [Cohnella lubricantis]|uniref:SWIM zinc finger family protein n=1 Tax=Cohnella lubricantis TaxID=2163172 RepID=A0A841TES4_9BACL|nr:SWIM zinc finger family protein [Cohnella lubricantis]MBB6678575.1 SWIM zinc finger family protein [Cohnella lubricantis]MBP2119115.1 hypothetical protein [Cohnella lubricantis]
MNIPTELTLTDEQWSRLTQFVAEQFDDLTIKRGYQYYKQGRVVAFQAAGDGEMKAIVSGSEVYDVNIFLDKLSRSDCDCPVGRPCKHMVAVLMTVAEQAGRSVHVLANAKMNFAARPALEGSAIEKRGAKRETPLLKAEHQAALLPGMSVPQWHDWFELCVEPLLDHTRNPHYVKQAWANIQRWKPALTAAADRLFELNAYLFLLSKLTSEAFLGYFTNIAASDVKQAAMQCLENELPLAAEPDQTARLLETADYVRRRLLFKSPHSDHFSAPYFELWSRWIPPQADGADLYDAELAALKSAADSYGADLNRTAWLTARSWIHLLRGEDREARDSLAEAGSPTPRDVLRLLRRLYELQAWERLADWLAGCAVFLDGYRRDVLAEYAQLWETAVRQRPEEEARMWRAIVGLLPRSGQIYEEKLLAFGKWRQWIDYQLSSGHDPLDFRAADLQPIEKADPEALLPFYHQAVERYVLLKNRDGYKQAVKLLKRLAKLYKKTKREDRWAYFFETFVDRHSRLRALQEELRKGKLIL